MTLGRAQLCDPFVIVAEFAQDLLGVLSPIKGGGVRMRLGVRLMTIGCPTSSM